MVLVMCFIYNTPSVFVMVLKYSEQKNAMFTVSNNATTPK
jgi:hypothetical protein